MCIPAVNTEKVFVGCHQRCELVNAAAELSPGRSVRAAWVMADIAFLCFLTELGHVLRR